jgi:voltage-gated potassium channel
MGESSHGVTGLRPPAARCQSRGPAMMKARTVVLLLAFPAVLLVAGTVGYVLIEGWPVVDALYMTVITLTTLGFGEVHPLSTGGRWFTMGLALGGVFTFLTAATTIIALAVSGELWRTFTRSRMERKLEQISGHVIVCGHGRMGRLVVHALTPTQLEVVTIDHQPEAIEPARTDGVLALHGDAGSDAVLERAGVRRARALVAALGSDADNVFLTLSARALNPKLFIVARAVEEATEGKLTRAGANRVISPFSLGGYVAANAILHPTVLDILELANRAGHLQVQVEEVAVAASSPLCGRTLGDARLREQPGVLLIAVRRRAGDTIFNPPDTLKPEADDVLVSMGTRERLDQLERLAGPR